MVGNQTPMKPHVAIVPSFGLGHLIPLFEFAKHPVLRHGIRVSLLVVTTNEPSAAEDQLLSSHVPPDLHIVKLPPVDVGKVPLSDGKLILTRFCVITYESLRSLKSVLVAIGKPKALVTDLFTTQAFDVCNELSIPAYVFSTTSSAFSAFLLYLPKFDSEVECEFIDLPEPIQVPGCTPVRPQDLLNHVRNRKIDEYKWFLHHMNTSTSYLPDWALIKQEETLSRTDVECLEWLDNQPSDSVIFVTFGSGGTLSVEQQTELAWGLELSQQRFIWVLRKPTDAACAGTFFNTGSEVNESKAYLPEGFLNKTQGVGLVVPSWAPQVSILGHPSTSGFLSHFG
ncbi:hypothetical protein DITRI_Ditri02bG0196900 [Diplodiscus trichospermus]